MAEIVKIKKDGVIQYPITKPECVIDENGKNVLQLIKENGGGEGCECATPDWNAEEGEVGYIANKPCFSLKTVNSRLDNLNPYFNTDFENGTFYPKHDLYVEYENKTIFMCKKDTELYYGDGITIIDDNENIFFLDGDSETGEIFCVGGGYDFELIFSLDKKYIGFQSTEDTTVTPDWSAPEGKEGHILNRTHYKDAITSPIGKLSYKHEWDGQNLIRVPFIDGGYIDAHIDTDFLMDYTPDPSLEGTYIGIVAFDDDYEACLELYGGDGDGYDIEIRASDKYDGVIDIDSLAFISFSIKTLGEEFIPDTIARTSELTELSAEVGKKVDADFVNNAIATAIGEAIDGGY